MIHNNMRLFLEILLIITALSRMEYIIAYPGEESVLERNEDVIKAPSDKRTYRGLRLKNDLKILLISDSFTRKSAACLTVGVGGLNDFVKVQGLANLVGYSLIKGSESYPIPFHLSQFIRKHNGDFQLPATTADVQQFSFDIDPVFLKSALDRLARSFFEPLLLLNNTDEEFLKDVIDVLRMDFFSRGMKDEYRVQQVERSLCRRNNPYCNLFTGSVETLFQHTKDLQNILQWNDRPNAALASLFDKVRQFYKNWYAASNMTLAVLGKEPLDTLEEMVVPLFENIRNWEVRKFVYGPSLQPWGSTELGHVFYIKPTKVDGNENYLRLNFPVPDTHKQYRTKPETFISELIKYDGPNSLLFTLRSQRLAFLLDTEYTSTNGISFFRITCQLTNLGVNRVGTVINMIFQYINLIRLCDKNTLRERFTEIGNAFHADFLDGTYANAQPLSQVETSARFMLDYSTENVLTIDYFLDQWDEPLIEEFLRCITPNNMNISIVSQQAIITEKTNQAEKHYETIYGKEKITKHLIQDWKEVKPMPELKLRPHNEFVPENFNLYALGENETEHPDLLHVSSKTEIWFKQDDEFKIPRLHVLLQVYSWTSTFGPNAYSLWYFVCHALRLSLDQNLFAAKTASAGFSWRIEVTPPSEFTIEVFGYDDKFLLLFEKILSEVVNFGNEIEKGYFDDMIQEYFQDMKKSIQNHVYKVDWFLQCALLNDWCVESVYHAGIKLQYDELKRFLSRRFKRVFVRAFIHGNCTREVGIVAAYTRHAYSCSSMMNLASKKLLKFYGQKSTEIVNIIEKSFQSSGGLLLQEIVRSRTVEMADGFHYIYQTSNGNSDLYAYSSIFRINADLSDLKVNVASLLLFKVIRDTCSQILSNVKQITKSSTNCELKNYRNMRVLLITVVSEKDPRFVEKSVETFLRDAIIKMSSLPKEEFKQIKDFIWEHELKVRHLKDLTKKYWFEITNRSYNFDSTELQLELLHSMTSADCVAILRKMLVTAPERSKLAIHMFPRDTKKIKLQRTMTTQKTTKVENADDFRNRLNLLPILVR